MPSITIGSVAAAATIASSAVSVGSTLLGSGKQSGQIADGQAQANDAQTAALEQARSDLAPWRQSGETGLGKFEAMPQPGDLENYVKDHYEKSPGYDFALSEGLRAVDAGAAAKGMLRSGATLKGEEAFGQGLARQDYGNYYNRVKDDFGTYYNRLFDLSKLGENAAAKSGDASVATGQGIASTDAAAAGRQAQITGSETTNLNNAFGMGLGAVNKFLTSSPSVYSGGATNTISNPNVLGGSYQSSSNPDFNF